MGKRDRGKRGGGDGKGRWHVLQPDAAEVMVAWANLLVALIQTMQDEDVGSDVIHRFLDHLDIANLEMLEGETLGFVLHVTTEFRRMVPSND